MQYDVVSSRTTRILLKEKERIQPLILLDRVDVHPGGSLLPQRRHQYRGVTGSTGSTGSTFNLHTPDTAEEDRPKHPMISTLLSSGSTDPNQRGKFRGFRSRNTTFAGQAPSRTFERDGPNPYEIFHVRIGHERCICCPLLLLRHDET